MKKVFKIIFRVERVIASVSMAAIVITSIVNVLGRYIFKHGITGAEDVIQLFFCWLIFVGASCCYGQGMHYGMDFLLDKMKGKFKAAWMLTINIIIMCASIFLAVQGWKLMTQVAAKVTGTLRISYFYIDMAALVGFVFMVIHGIDIIIQAIRTLSGKEEVTEDQSEPKEGGAEV